MAAGKCDVAIHNSYCYVASVDDSKGTKPVITVNVLAFEKDISQLTIRKCLTYSLEDLIPSVISRECTLLLKRATDTNTATKRLYLVLLSGAKLLLFTLCVESIVFVFSVPHNKALSSSTSSSTIHVADGPTFCIQNSSELSLFYLHDSRRAPTVASKTLVKSGHNCRIMDIKLCITCNHAKHFVVLVQYISDKMQDEQEQSVIVVLLTLEKGTIKLKEPDIQEFLPKVYTSIAQSCKLTLLRKGQEISDVAHPNQTLICTTFRQILEFRNGEMTACISMPFDNIRMLEMFENIADVTFYTILSDSGKLRVIDKQQKQVCRFIAKLTHIYIYIYIYNT